MVLQTHFLFARAAYGYRFNWYYTVIETLTVNIVHISNYEIKPLNVILQPVKKDEKLVFKKL